MLFTIIIPLRCKDIELPGDSSREEEFERFLKGIDKYGSIEQLLLLVGNEYFSEVSLTEVNSNDIPSFVNKKFGEMYANAYVKLSLKTSFSEAYDPFSIVYNVNSILQRLSMLINITYSTAVVFLPSVIFEGEIFIGRTDIVIHSFDFAYLDSIKNLWPRYDKLPFEQVVNWFLKHNISFDGKSSTPAGKAINALSYLMSSDVHEDTTAHLFWAMLGIEAIYSDGNSGIQKQISDKLKIVFGEKDFRKSINNLYNYRSRLIHGDFDFPSKFNTEDTYKEFNREFYAQISFATSILLASIKRLVSLDSSRFEFELVIKKIN